jgi:hypothetical protein
MTAKHLLAPVESKPSSSSSSSSSSSACKAHDAYGPAKFAVDPSLAGGCMYFEKKKQLCRAFQLHHLVWHTGLALSVSHKERYTLPAIRLKTLIMQAPWLSRCKLAENPTPCMHITISINLLKAPLLSEALLLVC